MKKSATVVFILAACAPRAAPLKGVLAPDRALPAISMASGHRHIVFRWDYQEGDIAARGDGSIRTAAPDSARLDFFLGGGLGAGGAILIGDSLRTPHADLARRYIPPSPMMWAALGRLAIPPLPDTVIRIDGGLVRADIGRPVQWRVCRSGVRPSPRGEISAPKSPPRPGCASREERGSFAGRAIRPLA